MKRDFIGASDAPVLLGLGDQTEEQLAARILHSTERPIEPKARAWMDRGTAFEPKLLSAYEAIYDVTLERKYRATHPLYPYLGAAPDGRYADDPSTLVECKTRVRFAQSEKVAPEKKFGWAGSDIVPAVYAAQVQFQLEVCDAEVCHVWVSFGADSEAGWVTDWCSRYPVGRDRQMGANLVALAVDFWQRRILSARRPVPPETDGMNPDHGSHFEELGWEPGDS